MNTDNTNKDDGRTINLSNMLIGLLNPFEPIDPSETGVEVVANNLRVLANFLNELAGRLNPDYQPIDALHVVGLYYTLPYYQRILPELLKKQIEAAHFLLPKDRVEHPSILAHYQNSPSGGPEKQ